MMTSTLQASDPSVDSLNAALGDRYELLSKLGEGGFGWIYKARQQATDREVAIKVMRLLQGDNTPPLERQIARFQREMRLCARLYHPHIVRFIDSGEVGNELLYIVFDFVPGETLAAVLSREQVLKPPEAIRLMAEVLDALHCAHSNGIVHRDLKPVNIMVTRTGARRSALILDFGIGALIDRSSGGDGDPVRLTGTYEVIGTPAYASPEQLRGQTPTPRSDLYSWGLVFLECLTGRRPITGSHVSEIFLQQLGPEAIELPGWLRGHPLGRLLERALVKDAHLRNVTAFGLLQELETLVPVIEQQFVAQVAQSTHALPVELRRPAGSASSAAAKTVAVDRSPGAVEVPAPDDPRWLRYDSNWVLERRQLTAVCCDLKVSAEPAHTLALEQRDRLLRTQHLLCTDLAERFEGQIASAFGERVLLYFGYPEAREDDARRAGLAARALLAEFERYNACHAEKPGAVQLTARIGIHTGLSIVRKQPGTVHSLHDIVGVTSETALQLNALAELGDILISEDAHRLLRPYFTCTPVGALQPAGGGEPVRVFRVEAELVPEMPSESFPGKSALPLIGREQELELLLHRWQQATAGIGQSALIIGEAGIGKSRLIQELHRRIGEQAHRWLECRCAYESRNKALRPIVDLLERVLKSESEDIDAALESLLSRCGFDLDSSLSLFADLLALPPREHFRTLEMAPDRHKALTLDALSALLFTLAEEQPLVLFVEDLHWADPTTLELLALLVEEAVSVPLYLVLSARPEFASDWAAADLLQLRLNRLGGEQAAAMVTAVAGKSLPAEVVAEIVQRTDGVALFVEELTRMMLTSGIVQEHEDRYVLTGAIGDLSIPSTLRDLLTARLDRVGRAKGTAQLAAALGREFPYDLLVAVSVSDQASLDRDLKVLVESGVLYRRRRPQQPLYAFRHALIRDAAYESMIEDTRRRVHRVIAATLERQFAELEHSRPELLAHHHAAAGQYASALRYTQRAASMSLRRSANAEALGHVRQAMDWLDALSDSMDRDRVELDLQSVAMPALLARHGHSAPAVVATARRCLELTDRLGDDQRVFPALWGLSLYHHHRSDRPRARALLQRYVDLAERLNDTDQLVAALPLLCQCHQVDGRFDLGRSLAERALSLYDPERHRLHGATYGLDPAVLAHLDLFLDRWHYGYPEQALHHARQALALARELQHANTISLSLLYLMWVHQLRGEPDEVLVLGRENREFCDRHGLVTARLRGDLIYHWAAGEAEPCYPILESILEARALVGVATYFKPLVAEIELSRGHHARALELIAECLDLAETCQERFRLGYLHYLKGVTLWQGRLAEPDAVERSWQTSLDIAREQDSRLQALITHTAWCRFIRQRGADDAVARRALAEVYGRFSEGFDSGPLREARAVLDDV